MPDDNELQDDNSLNSIVESGTEIVGAVTGAAIGLIGGPAASIAGAIAGPVVAKGLKKLGREIRQQQIAPKQEARIGGAIAVAIKRMQQLKDSGNEVRDDLFFSGDSHDFEEVAEGVSLTAKDEFEEKKIPYIGNLLAGIAYSSGINKSYANFLNKLAGDLTFRQLVLLRIFSETSLFSLRSSSLADADGRMTVVANVTGVLTEIKDLESRSLISSGTTLFALPQIIPSRLRTEGAGSTLVQLMCLKEIPDTDIQEVVALLT